MYVYTLYSLEVTFVYYTSKKLSWPYWNIDLVHSYSVSNGNRILNLIYTKVKPSWEFRWKLGHCRHFWRKSTYVAFHLEFVSNSVDTLRLCSEEKSECVLPKNASSPSLYFDRIWACSRAMFINVYEKIDCVKNYSGKYYVL